MNAGVPTTPVRLVPHAGVTLGIDIGGTAVKAALVDADGAVVAEGMSPPHEKPDAETVTGSVWAAVENTMGRETLGRAPIARIGVGVPGVLSAGRDRVLNAVNLPGLIGLDLARMVRGAVGVDEAVPVPVPVPVTVCSDAFAVSYGWWSREKPSGRSMVMVLGTGVGVAVLDDGVPLEVTGAGPGHWGQIDVGPIQRAGRLIGPDGGAHSLEAFVGARALERHRDAWGALDEHHPAVIALSRAVRIGLALLRPDRIVLLGGVGEVLGPGIPAIRGLVERDLTSVAPREFDLQAVAGRGFGAVGAAAWAVARGVVAPSARD